ncbi:MAG TPA: hypothetical protein DEA43_03435 [Candidatus Moranbacteria bacterium]|nr:hypothetical protein [Candidatus Moranbacteria bacterium]HBT45908.1 hypothetical protein [Candidatus Moranbacteria bacterium]
MKYKHTQIGYLMLVVTLAVAVLFAWAYITASAEPPSVDSGTNLLVTAVMVLIILILASFTSLQVIVDEKYLRIRFGWGVFKKKFLLDDIASAKTVKNHWYYGWGIRGWLWPEAPQQNNSCIPHSSSRHLCLKKFLSYLDSSQIFLNKSDAKLRTNCTTYFVAEPRMWIYNISGFDAVEIKMKNGKLYRVGTDEPEKLEQVILQSIK